MKQRENRLCSVGFSLLLFECLKLHISAWVFWSQAHRSGAAKFGSLDSKAILSALMCSFH